MSTWWVPGLFRRLWRHPRDAIAVARAAWRLRRNGWWRQSPWLPLPSRDYWDFRLHTAGGSVGEVSPEDVVSFARWALTQRAAR